MPNIKSLYINLVEESQVNLVMKNIQQLEFLNGLPIEKQELSSENSFRTDDSMQEVMEDVEAEDMEDDYYQIQQNDDTQILLNKP